MKSFAEILDGSLRLALLRLLEEAPGYSANTAVLTMAVKSLGFHVSRDKVTSTLDWLKEQGVVTCEAVGPVIVAKITSRGLDVAAGLATVTGIDRPTPKG